MAFIPEETDPNNPQPGGAQPMNQPPQTASGIGAGTTGVSTPQGTTSIPTATKAPPVANLSDYLKANAPQTQDMAGKIAGNLQTQATQVQTDLASGQKSFEDAVKAGSVAANPDLVSRAAANPSEFVKNPDDVAEFKKEASAAYTGPQDFTTSDPYKTLSAEVDRVAPTAPDPTNPNDFRPFVAGLETNPTPGMTALDNLLIQGSPDAAKTINDARAPFSSLKQYLQDLLTKENQTATDARTATAAAPVAVKAAFDPLKQSFTKGLTDKAQKAEADRLAFNASINANQAKAIEAQKALQTASDAAKLRYTGNVKNEMGSTANSDPVLAALAAKLNPATYLDRVNPYLSGTPIGTPADLSTVATPDEYATDAALESLLSGSYTPALDPANASKAGTFSIPGSAGSVPDVSGEVQYINDVADLYGNPFANFASVGIDGKSDTDIANALIYQSKIPGSGIVLSPDDRAALDRIIANNYPGR